MGIIYTVPLVLKSDQIQLFLVFSCVVQTVKLNQQCLFSVRNLNTSIRAQKWFFQGLCTAIGRPKHLSLLGLFGSAYAHCPAQQVRATGLSTQRCCLDSPEQESEARDCEKVTVSCSLHTPAHNSTLHTDLGSACVNSHSPNPLLRRDHQLALLQSLSALVDSLGGTTGTTPAPTLSRHPDLKSSQS